MTKTNRANVNGACDKTMYIVDGGKGGLAKSLLSTIAADRILACGHAANLLVIDGDVTNPDVSRRFRSTGASIAQADLRLPDEWISVLDMIEQAKAKYVVISLPATSSIGERAQSIRLVTNELGYRIVTFFLIAKTPDSIDLLAASYETGTVSISDTFMVVINEYFGKSGQSFRRFDDSVVKRDVLADHRSSGILVMPELFYSAEDVLHAAAEHSPSQIIASGQLTIATRIELDTWRKRIWSQIEKTELRSDIETAKADVS